jgi:3-deoxy-D-manno-octulosonate 8-phosphate phosphatase (KDO 8-P phosphatase)
MLTPDLRRAAQAIKCLALDIDGVLTDGSVFFDAQGECFKVFNSLDGHGIRLLMEHGIQVAVISGRNSPIIQKRLKEFGVKHFYLGRLDKINACQELMQALNIPSHEIAYIGDDLPDLPVIEQVGLGVAVQNAHPYVKSKARWVTQATGGQGAVREVCDWILSAQGMLEKLYTELHSLKLKG